MQHEMEQYMLNGDGRHGSKVEKRAHREFLKQHFKNLPADVLDVYVKACRERLAYHGFIEEAVVDTLNDNNEQSFRQLDKVYIVCTTVLAVHTICEIFLFFIV
jgi:hypothetical protein